MRALRRGARGRTGSRALRGARPRGIATQMDRELACASDHRDLPLRQQTVETTIRWSYDLLAPQEQWCFLPPASSLASEIAVFSDKRLEILGATRVGRTILHSDYLGDRLIYCAPRARAGALIVCQRRQQ